MHFADDTNLLINNNSPQQLPKQLKMISQVIYAIGKMSLNATKTELLIFRHPNKN